MLDAFDSPRELMVAARDHINDLEVRIKAFYEPYVSIIVPDAKTGENVQKVRLTAKIPGRIAGVAKDAFSNLRDTLDHAVYASTSR